MLVIIYGSLHLWGDWICIMSVRQKVTNFKHTKGAPHSLLVNDVRKTILEGDSGMWSLINIKRRKCLIFFVSRRIVHPFQFGQYK